MASRKVFLNPASRRSAGRPAALPVSLCRCRKRGGSERPVWALVGLSDLPAAGCKHGHWLCPEIWSLVDAWTCSELCLQPGGLVPKRLSCLSSWDPHLSVLSWYPLLLLLS